MIALAGSELDEHVELMERVVEGDQRAFRELYDRLSGMAFSLALRIVGDRGTAADVTQEAFLELWNGRDRYQRDKGAPRAWLLGIVRNRAIDAYRHSRSRGGPPREQQWITEQPGPDRTEDQVVAGDQVRIVRAALDKLSAEQRAVVDLAYFGGLTQAEIAARLGLPLGTVKGRVRLAMKHLQAGLAELA
jgi:RNA polymerase sigma-70 factor, ECF subfamily